MSLVKQHLVGDIHSWTIWRQCLSVVKRHLAGDIQILKLWRRGLSPLHRHLATPSTYGTEDGLLEPSYTGFYVCYTENCDEVAVVDCATRNTDVFNCSKENSPSSRHNVCT